MKNLFTLTSLHRTLTVINSLAIGLGAYYLYDIHEKHTSFVEAVVFNFNQLVQMLAMKGML